MATDERNFRSTYYEKVGFRSVEEKKSLEILLKDKPLDRGKLKQFCLRYSVPSVYRNLLWKVLLGVVPVHLESHSFIMTQRQKEFSDLQHALNVLKIIDSNTPKPQVFLAMWLLQTGNLTYNYNLYEDRDFLQIIQALIRLIDGDDTDIYWIGKTFYDNIIRFESDFRKLREISFNLLAKDQPALYDHFDQYDFIEKLPVIEWFYCCFAGIINENSLAKIWDKLCGGSCKILVYVVNVLFSNLEHRLKDCNDLPSIMQHIYNISEETSEVIVNTSIDMWQQHGSLLTVHDKPKP